MKPEWISYARTRLLSAGAKIRPTRVPSTLCMNPNIGMCVPNAIHTWSVQTEESKAKAEKSVKHKHAAKKVAEKKIAAKKHATAAVAAAAAASSDDVPKVTYCSVHMHVSVL
jgi:hypothetical protein